MGLIEDLVERFISQDILFKDFEIDYIENVLKRHIEYCEESNTKDRIKAYSFLHDKCDYIIKNIALSMNYKLEYEPTDDDIWSFVEREKNRIDPKNDDLSGSGNYIYYKSDEEDSFDESTLYDSVIGDMTKEYDEKNKDAFEWCKKIRDIQIVIFGMIQKEKEKLSFFDEALNAEAEIVKTTMDEYYTTCLDKGKLNTTLVQLLRGEKGKNVAETMIALEKLGYIDFAGSVWTQLFRVLKKEFAVEGEYEAFRVAANKLVASKDDRTKTSIKNKMKILEQ